MVAVELAGDVVSTGHVEQVLVADSTVTNLTVGHVGQSLVTVITLLLSAVRLFCVMCDLDPGIVRSGQVGHGL